MDLVALCSDVRIPNAGELFALGNRLAKSRLKSFVGRSSKKVQMSADVLSRSASMIAPTAWIALAPSEEPRSSRAIGEPLVGKGKSAMASTVQGRNSSIAARRNACTCIARKTYTTLPPPPHPPPPSLPPPFPFSPPPFPFPTPFSPSNLPPPSPPSPPPPHPPSPTFPPNPHPTPPSTPPPHPIPPTPQFLLAPPLLRSDASGTARTANPPTFITRPPRPGTHPPPPEATPTDEPAGPPYTLSAHA